MRGTTLEHGDAARPTDAPPSTTPSPPSGPMTRARAKLLQAKVNSLLSSCDFNTSLDGLLLHAQTLCILIYEPNEASPREGQKATRGDPLEQIGARPDGPVSSPEFSATG